MYIMLISNWSGVRGGGVASLSMRVDYSHGEVQISLENERIPAEAFATDRSIFGGQEIKCLPLNVASSGNLNV